MGYLEGVAFFSPLIIPTSGKSPGSLETLGKALAQAGFPCWQALTWKQSNPGFETWK